MALRGSTFPKGPDNHAAGGRTACFGQPAPPHVASIPCSLWQRSMAGAEHCLCRWKHPRHVARKKRSKLSIHHMSSKGRQLEEVAALASHITSPHGGHTAGGSAAWPNQASPPQLRFESMRPVPTCLRGVRPTPGPQSHPLVWKRTRG